MALEKIRPRVVDATGNYAFNNVDLTGNISSRAANVADLTGVNNLVASGNSITVTGSLSTTANISAGNIKTDHLLYANGAQWAIGEGATISGTNTQVQFNDASTFGASSNFTFNKNTNTLTVTNISANGALLTNISGGSVTGTVANASYATSAGTATSATTAATVTTAAQTAITSVGTLTSLDITGNLSAGNANLGNLTVSNFFSGSGNNLSNIQGSNVSGQVGYANVANSVAGGNVSGAVTYAATANAVAGSNVMGAVGLANYATTANSVAGGNVTGEVSTANIAWRVSNASQPNITSVGTLANLSVTGNITGGNANLGNAVTANFFIGNGSSLTGIAAVSANYIANGNSNVTIPTANGNVNISVANTANVVVITGTGVNIAGTANITGNVSAPYFIGNGAFLTGVDTTPANISNGNSNVNIPTANGNVNFSVSNVANILVITGTGANLTGTLNVSGDATVGNIVTGTGTGGNITGANIISANTLTASGNITAGNANLGNAVTANYFIGNFYGTANLATYATTANGVAGGNVSGEVATANLAWRVSNASQPNITSLGTLTGLAVTGDTILTGNLTVSGSFEYANVTSFRVKDPIIEQGGNTAGGALTTNDGFDRGQLLHYYSGSSAVDAFMGWDNSNAEFAFGSNVSITSEVATFNTFGNVRAGFFIGNGSALTGVTALSANYIANGNSNVNIPTANGNVNISASNVANVVVITGTGVNVAGTANITGNVNAPYFIGNGAFLTGVDTTPANISNGNSQVNIPAGNGNITVNVAGVSNTVVFSNAGVNVAGYVTATGNLTAGNIIAGTGTGGNITNANVIGANTFTASGNITSGNANLGNAVTANYFIGNGSSLTGIVAVSANYIANGNSNVNIASSNGNITVSVTGVSNTVVFSNVGVNIAGYANITGNVNAPYFIGNGAFLTGVDTSPANISNGNSQVNVPAGNGNITVNVTGVSNTVVFSNVGVNIAGYLTVNGNITAGNANLGNAVVANYFIGDGSLITGVDLLSVGGADTANRIANGTSTIDTPIIDGNITVTIGGVSNTVVFSNTGVNINGYLNATSISTGGGSGNLSGANWMIANYFSGAGNNLSNIQGSNVTGAVTYATTANAVAVANVSGIGNISTVNKDGNASNILYGNGVFAAITPSSSYGNSNVAGFLAAYGSNTISTTGNISAGNINAGNLLTANYSTAVLTTATQPNITSVGTLTSLAVTGNTTSGNFIGVFANGNSNINIPSANGNINFSAEGNANIVAITGTGVNVTGTFDSTGNIHTNASVNIDGLLMVSSSNGNDATKGIAFPLPGGAGADSNASIRYYHYGSYYQTVFEIGVGNNLINASGQDSINLVASGGVGIKTLTPSVEFEVTGRAKVSGNTEIGGLLTGTGNVAFSGANVTLGAVANLHITGGSTGQYLQTDGSGTLSWANVAGGGGSNINNYNSNVNIPSANSNVNISVANNPNIVVVTSTGANINGYANITGNVSLGGANVSLGTVSNLHIGGGSNTYVLSTDGAGNLSWASSVASSLGVAVDNFTGNGVAVNYTLASTPANINCTIVSIAGLFQPRTVYSLSGNVVTFSSAPKNTAPIEITTLSSTGGGGAGGGSALTIQDEGSNLTTTASLINFVGNGISSTNVGNSVTVTVNTGGITAQDLLSPFLLMGA